MLIFAHHSTQHQAVFCMLVMVMRIVKQFLFRFMAVMVLFFMNMGRFTRLFLFVVMAFVFAGLVSVVMVVTRLHLHALGMDLFQQFHAVHHPHHISLQIDGAEDGLHPGVGLAAQIDEQVALLHGQNVRRGRLVGMAFRTRRQQQRHIGQFSRGGPCQVEGREHRHNDVQRVLPRRSAFDMILPASGQQQCRRQEQGHNSLSHRLSSII